MRELLGRTRRLRDRNEKQSVYPQHHDDCVRCNDTNLRRSEICIGEQFVDDMSNKSDLRVVARGVIDRLLAAADIVPDER